MQQQLKGKGLTGFQLKYLAVGLMLLDHIHYFFEFIGKVPLFFSWLGRLALHFFYFVLSKALYTRTTAENLFSGFI